MRISDWSSDVCSSDLGLDAWRVGRRHFLVVIHDTDELVRRRRAVAFTGASADRLCVAEVGAAKLDRKRVVLGKRVSVRVVLGSRRLIYIIMQNKLVHVTVDLTFIHDQHVITHY